MQVDNPPSPGHKDTSSDASMTRSRSTSRVEDEPVFGEQFNEEEERLLDRKYTDAWTPYWMNNNPFWRLVARLAVCGIAIGLLWVSSLTVSTAVAGLYVATPTYKVVYDEWAFVVELAEKERHVSYQCVERQLQQCRDRLDKTSKRKQRDSAETAADNTIKLKLRDSVRLACLNAHDQSLGSVGKLLDAAALNTELSWATNGNIYTTDASCTADDKNRLEKLMSDSSKVKSELYAQNADFASESLSSMDRLRISIDARNDYDREYAYNKTKAIWDTASALSDAVGDKMADIKGVMPAFDVHLDRLHFCSQPGGPQPPSPFAPPCSVNVTMLYLNMRVNLTANLTAYRDNIVNKTVFWKRKRRKDVEEKGNLGMESGRIRKKRKKRKPLVQVF
eukprot:g45113.t1